MQSYYFINNVIKYDKRPFSRIGDQLLYFLLLLLGSNVGRLFLTFTSLYIMFFMYYSYVLKLLLITPTTTTTTTVTAMGSYMTTKLSSKQFWSFHGKLFFCVLSLFFSLVWSWGLSWKKKGWCDIFACINQNAAAFESKSGDSRVVVCLCCQAAVNQMCLNHPHSILMKQIPWMLNS